jgi:outer membrane protein assembly factor BamB
VLWSIGTAQIASSPAVGADGRVYFGSMDGYLYCVQGGNLIWQVKTDGQINSSPAIGRDGTVFVTSDDGYVYAVR